MKKICVFQTKAAALSSFLSPTLHSVFFQLQRDITFQFCMSLTRIVYLEFIHGSNCKVSIDKRWHMANLFRPLILLIHCCFLHDDSYYYSTYLDQLFYKSIVVCLYGESYYSSLISSKDGANNLCGHILMWIFLVVSYIWGAHHFQFWVSTETTMYLCTINKDTIDG